MISYDPELRTLICPSATRVRLTKQNKHASPYIRHAHVRTRTGAPPPPPGTHTVFYYYLIRRRRYYNPTATDTSITRANNLSLLLLLFFICIIYYELRYEHVFLRSIKTHVYVCIHRVTV